MKPLKRITVFILTIILMTYSINKTIYSSIINTRTPVRVSVLLSKFDTLYLTLVQKALEDIQAKNQNNVEFTFFDGKGNQAMQNETIDKLLLEGNTDLLLVNLVNRRLDIVTHVVNEARQYDLPIIFFNTIEPESINAIKSYPKGFVVSTDVKHSGILEGQILVDAWNTDKASIDKNKDNILQYIMLQGDRNSEDVILRTRYSISTINDAGIKTEELALVNANLNKETAKNAVNSLFLRYGNKIEAIISNNDAMAIGAIEALQSYGYNTGDKSKTIQVVGIDAIPEARELIKQGFMTGSVIQDPRLTAEALYTIGLNLFFNKYPLEDTNYKFDDTGIVIRLPYEKYNKNSDIPSFKAYEKNFFHMPCFIYFNLNFISL